MNNNILFNMARKAMNNENFIASLILVYIEAERIDWKDLSNSLEISFENLLKLALCNRPRRDVFMEDIEKISHFADIPSLQLIKFIRKSESLEVFQKEQNESNWLMAARDRDQSTDVDE